jgi:alpha/beta superfamily hydrolase
MRQALRRGLLALLLWAVGGSALAQDYAREQRWADEILATLVVGDPVWLAQGNGHRFLGLYTRAKNERGAVVIAHGRGWSPDYDLYGELRTKLADAGYSTLSIQMPVLPSTAHIGAYLPTFGDADERLAVAIDWLHAKGARHVAIVSHSLGATMANHYLINAPAPRAEAWVMVSIINGLEDMFRVKIPVLDVFGGADWEVTRVGAAERKAQIEKMAGSRQVVIDGAEHFFEGRRDELTRTIVSFLDSVLGHG